MKFPLILLATTLLCTAVFSQNVGIGEPNPASKFSVKGNLAIGNNYTDDVAPVNGAIIEGNVGIGTVSTDASAALDVRSTNQGVLLPSVNLATAVFPGVGPATGLVVWNNNAGFANGVGLYFNSGSNAVPAWQRLSTANNTVTTVNANSPLSSSGGITPTISLTGTVPVSNGGTGKITLPLNGIVLGNGSSAVNNISIPATPNTYLRWNGTGYDWVTSSTNLSNLTEAAGGGLSAFSYNGSTAVQIGIANLGVDNGKLANDAVTSNKIQDLTITNADIANSTIDLTTKVAGVLPVTNGGIGVNTITGVVIGNGTSAVSGTAASAGSQYLRRNSGNTAYEFGTFSTTDIPDLGATYVKNQTGVQTSASFNVDGSGGVGTNLTVGNNTTVGGDVTVTGNDINGAATGSANININSRGGARIQLDSDNNGSEDFAVKNGSNVNAFTVTEGGNVSAIGNGDFNGNLSLTGNSRILSSGDALDVSSTSGIDVILDSDNNGTGAEFLVKKDIAGTSLFRTNEDGNTRIFNPNSPAAGGNLTIDGLSGSGTRIVTTDASGVLGAGAAATTLGTVQSVGLSLPNIFAVSNSPVTTTGTLTGTLNTQTANTVFAGPTSGGAVAPTFRALVAADIPNLDASKITTGILPIARGGTATGSTPGNGQLLIGNGTGYSIANISGTTNQVNVANGAGTITLSTPQDIHTGASPTFSNLTVSNTNTAATYTFPAPTGDPAPVITARTIPTGQGNSNERTELILFHSNDPAGNGSGEDVITLRAPGIRLQTYNNAVVASINDNAGSNDRLYINATGTVQLNAYTTNGLLKTTGSNGTLAVATSGTDFQAPIAGGTGISISGGNTINSTWTTSGTNIYNNNSGNVGIGVTGPIRKLEVAGDIVIGSSAGNRQIYTWDANDANWRIGTSSTPGFTRALATSHVQYMTFANGVGQGFALGDNVSGLSAFEVASSGNSYQAYFRGNVGIATTSTPHRLTVSGNTEASAYYVNHGGGDVLEVGDDAWIRDVNIGNTIGVQGTQNAAFGYVRFGNGNSSAVGYTTAGLSASAAGQIFDGTNGAILERTTGESGGIFAGDNWVDIWAADGICRFRDEDNIGTVVAFVNESGTIFQTSDANLKENIQPLTNALDKVRQLNAYSYQYKLDPVEIEKGDKPFKTLGFLSQEVKQVVPELVQEMEGNLLMNYDGITPILLQAIKEQQQMIEKLQKEVEELKNKQ